MRRSSRGVCDCCHRRRRRLGRAAQSFPSRPVTMVVPFPPGGNTDLMARALQTELAKALGQSVIISNKGGAAGTIGLLDLVRAEPDGYTIALTPNNPLTAQPHMQQQLRFGMDTFRYICLTYYTPYVLIAGPQAPFKTFAEFVTFAKAKSENLVYGHPGVAGQPHLVMLAVLKAIGADGWACRSRAPARCRTRCSAARSWRSPRARRLPRRATCRSSRRFPMSASRACRMCRP